MAAAAVTRIVLLGKTGSGKSSAGNVILGENTFFAGSDPNSVSKDCQTVEGNFNGRRISVTDTPGIFDTDNKRSEKDLKYSIISCLTECAPGPHVFILVMRVGRYTKEEKESVKMILECFGKEALKHTVVLFTHGDDLDKNQTIKEFVERKEDLKELVDKCGGRVHVIDSKQWNKKDCVKEMIKQKRAAGELQAVQALEELMNQLLTEKSSTPDQEPGQGSGRPSCSGGTENRSNSFQIKQLMTTIDTMVGKNRGRYYRNDSLLVIAEAIEIEVNNIKTEIGERGEKAEESEIRRQARERVRAKSWRLVAGHALNRFLEALFGTDAAFFLAVILAFGLLIAAAVAAGYKLRILDMKTFVRLTKCTAGIAVGATGAAAGAGVALEAGVAGAEDGARAAVGIGVGVTAGALTAVGGVLGGAVVAKAAARVNTVGESAGNAAEAVVEGEWNIVKETL